MRVALVVAVVSLGAVACASEPRGATTYAPGERGLSAGSAERGLATWYSDSLAGRHTASGRPYDPAQFTAAHRTLPFGTRVRVTREDSGASVEVQVNDRGPYGNARRIVDLSHAAASALEMLSAGVVRVRLDVLELGTMRYRRAR